MATCLLSISRLRNDPCSSLRVHPTTVFPNFFQVECLNFSFVLNLDKWLFDDFLGCVRMTSDQLVFCSSIVFSWICLIVFLSPTWFFAITFIEHIWKRNWIILFSFVCFQDESYIHLSNNIRRIWLVGLSEHCHRLWGIRAKKILPIRIMDQLRNGSQDVCSVRFAQLSSHECTFGKKTTLIVISTFDILKFNRHYSRDPCCTRSWRIAVIANVRKNWIFIRLQKRSY
jgi:hypothetical protein